MGEPKRAAGDVMGAATGTSEARGRLAYVFYPRVALLARGAPYNAESRILGHVIAHEMGHLLLPPNSHSQSVVMLADWDSEHLLAWSKVCCNLPRSRANLSEATCRAPIRRHECHII